MRYQHIIGKTETVVVLHFDSPEQAREANRANTRYSRMSRTKEESDRVVSVARRLLGKDPGAADSGLSFYGDDITYIETNMQAAAQNNADPRQAIVRAMLANAEVEYIPAGAIPEPRAASEQPSLTHSA